MVHNSSPLTPLDAISKQEKLRLRYLDKPFKGFKRVLLFYSLRTHCGVLGAFHNLLRQLGNERTLRVAVHEEPYIEPCGGLLLYASSDDGLTGKGTCKGITESGPAANPAFAWTCDPATWHHYSDLVSGLIQFGGGHQYLTSHAANDVQVIVSSGEYFDEDFEGS